MDYPTPWPTSPDYISAPTWHALKAFLKADSAQYRRHQRRLAAKKRLQHAVYGLEFRARLV